MRAENVLILRATLILGLAATAHSFGSTPDDHAKFYCTDAEVFATAEDTDATDAQVGAQEGSFLWCGHANSCTDYPSGIVGAIFGGNTTSCNGEGGKVALACDGSDFTSDGSPNPTVAAMLKHFCPLKCGGCDSVCTDKPDLLGANAAAFGSASTCMDMMYPAEWMKTDVQDVMVDPECDDTPGYTDAQTYTCASWAGACVSQTAANYGYTDSQFEDIVANCPVSCGTCPMVPEVNASGEPVYVWEKTGEHCDLDSTVPPSGSDLSTYYCDTSQLMSKCESIFRIGCATMSGICEPCS